ncbi:unnamed protein product [Rotaria socialis]|uniref:Ig-like domain-containing protein n=1 Tax=Rotaria socialis TaxID=392032 RepID=A0A820SR12_9BILA|nr:unnamed protein product [Rotaria socialis]CAF3294362.1 unnamed protein product [Rotaria socialis]CAF3417332.1 unnamed protein product [Rotaria socialis]CAF4139098.1 unnamed protein product [Rotaria socialis]CAF4453800.1 unnamed protein product [Rotaria socialis]
MHKLFFICLIVLNIVISSNAKYSRSPADNKEFKAILKHSLDLECKYNGADQDGEFLDWYKDGVPVSSEKSGHYVVHNSEKESKLTIKIFVPSDGQVQKWSVKTKKSGFEEPIECQFKRITPKRSPQRIDTDRPAEKLETSHSSIRRYRGEPVSFKCIIEPEPTDKTFNAIKWEFSKDDTNYSVLADDITYESKINIIINSIEKSHRGFYRCTLNGVSFTVLLRVKDRLAPLWPFLGIVGTVSVLVIVILIFEKRQKPARKAAGTEDEEHDHAKDPLVRTPNKSADDENKKRAVKA